MHFALPEFRRPSPPEPPALVRVVSRSDVMWNRPVFKAPPLVIEPQRFDAAAFTDDPQRTLRPEQRKT